MLSDSYNPRRIKVMFMGDSLTAGVGNSLTTAQGGYRSALIAQLGKRLGYPPEIVGSQYTNLTRNGMCGASGLRIDEITINPYAAVQVVQYSPDVIFLHIGTNDCTQLNTGGSPTLATSRANLTTLLDTIRSGAPNTIVFLARIIDNNTAHTEVVNFNESAIDIDVIARSDYTSGLIKIVDMYTEVGLYTVNNWADNTHLNNNGYALETSAWSTAFNTVF